MLIKFIASYISKILEEDQSNGLQEKRILFLGPSKKIMEKTFLYLKQMDTTHKYGIPIYYVEKNSHILESALDPKVSSISYDSLLSIRNSSSIFLALVSPENQNISTSLFSSSKCIGSSKACGNVEVQFEEWWTDSFIQQIVDHITQDIYEFKEDQLSQSKKIIESIGKSIDSYSDSPSSRYDSLWNLISRLFNAQKHTLIKKNKISAFMLACGLPNTEGDTIDENEINKIISQIEEAYSAGISKGTENLIDIIESEELSKGSPEIATNISEFSEHLEKIKPHPSFGHLKNQMNVLYSPNFDDNIDCIPNWWKYLTLSKWSDIFDSSLSSDEESGKLTVNCLNDLISQYGIGDKIKQKVVVDDIQLEIKRESKNNPQSFENELNIQLKGFDKEYSNTFKLGKNEDSISIPRFIPNENKSRKTPYSISALDISENYKKSSPIKVISLKNWESGAVFVVPQAAKVSIPKLSSSSKRIWNTEIVNEISGNIQVYILLNPKFKEDGIYQCNESPREKCDLVPEKIADNILLYAIDVKKGSNYEFHIKDETGKQITHILDFDILEIESQGCDSVFDMLIKRNNKESTHKKNAHLDVIYRANTKFANLERNLLNYAKSDDEKSIKLSCYPIVLSTNNQDVWIPQGNNEYPNILSNKKFISDPRPSLSEMNIPLEFLRARQSIFKALLVDESQRNIEEINLSTVANQGNIQIKDLFNDYITKYIDWLKIDVNAALCDTILIHQENDDGDLSPTPYAIILNPLHPIKLAWHFLAQTKLQDALDSKPCPSGCILSPNNIPSLLNLPTYVGGRRNFNKFISIESNSDYWTVLWNEENLNNINSILPTSPLNYEAGLTIASLTGSFSEVQVNKSLNDIAELLVAKPNISIAITGCDGISESTNRGLVSWIENNIDSKTIDKIETYDKSFSFYDLRNSNAHLDNSIISSFTDKSDQRILWFNDYKKSNSSCVCIDLGIMSQMSCQTYKIQEDETGYQTSPLSKDGMLAYTIRTPLTKKSISDSLINCSSKKSSDNLENLLTESIVCFENIGNEDHKKYTLMFSPSINKIEEIFEKQKAKYVAISSSTFDPSCFSYDAVKGAYLWDYDLPHYSLRAGDHNGYYLLTNISTTDQESLKNSIINLLSTHDNQKQLKDTLQKEQICSDILIEISKRGIPKIRTLSGFDTTSRGDLGVFVSTRILQDSFRTEVKYKSLLDIAEEDTSDHESTFNYINLLIPVDPFQDYIDDLCNSINLNRMRPDLIVASICIDNQPKELSIKSVKLTPVEIKFRKTELGVKDESHALEQAQSFYKLIDNLKIISQSKVKNSERKLSLWELTYQNLLLTMLSYGFRIYANLPISQNKLKSKWLEIEHKVAEFVFNSPTDIDIDKDGRIVEICDSNEDCFDYSKNKIVISKDSAAKIIVGDPSCIYEKARNRLNDWKLHPQLAKIYNKDKSEQNNQTNLEKKQPQEKNDLQLDNNGEILNPQSSNENTGINLNLGTDCESFKDENIFMNISNTVVNQLNIGITGDLGTGKTQLIKSIIYQISSSSLTNRGIAPNILLIDYKKDFSSNKSQDFIKAVNAKILNPCKEPIPLNIFDISEEIDENSSIDFDRKVSQMSMNLNEILSKINNGIGAVQMLNLKEAIRLAYDKTSDMPTIYDVYDAYKENTPKPDTPQFILDNLTSLCIFEKDKNKIVHFKDLFKGVVILDISDLKTEIKNTLIAIMLDFFYRYMLKLPKLPYFGDKPNQMRAVQSFLVVDEALNLMKYQFDTLTNVLTQDREFGTGVILASQYLSHFKQTKIDYKENLLTWFIHKDKNIQEKDLNKLGINEDAARIAIDISNLEELTCYFKSSNKSPTHIRDNAFFKITEKINLNMR